ncbi:MAG: secondary thiamine-phosphate synthase enzyme YjbQ [Candidatus Heimdallarchaeota archaeon]
MTTLTVKSKARVQFLNITKEVRKAVKQANIQEGICNVYVPHTTAGVTINESADPAVPTDIISTLEQLVPLDANYKHLEGNSDAHIKTLLTGSSVTIPIIKGNLGLGTWQAVFFTEYDGPRTRKLQIMAIGTND